MGKSVVKHQRYFICGYAWRWSELQEENKTSRNSNHAVSCSCRLHSTFLSLYFFCTLSHTPSEKALSSHIWDELPHCAPSFSPLTPSGVISPPEDCSEKCGVTDTSHKYFVWWEPKEETEGMFVLFWKMWNRTDAAGCSWQTPPECNLRPGTGVVWVTESESAFSSEIVKDEMMFSSRSTVHARKVGLLESGRSSQCVLLKYTLSALYSAHTRTTAPGSPCIWTRYFPADVCLFPLLFHCQQEMKGWSLSSPPLITPQEDKQKHFMARLLT